MNFNSSFVTKFLNAVLKMLDPIGIVALILLRRVQHFIGAKFTFTLSVLKNFMDPLEVVKYKNLVAKIKVLSPLYCLGMLGKSTSYGTGAQSLSCCFWIKLDNLTTFYCIFVICFTRSNFFCNLLHHFSKKSCYWTTHMLTECVA